MLMPVGAIKYSTLVVIFVFIFDLCMIAGIEPAWLLVAYSESVSDCIKCGGCPPFLLYRLDILAALVVKAFHCFVQFLCAIHFFGLVWFGLICAMSEILLIG
jgi:hypothetical protein